MFVDDAKLYAISSVSGIPGHCGESAQWWETVSKQNFLHYIFPFAQFQT